MKVVIVEDELNVRTGFKKMIEKFLPDLSIVGEAESITKGIELVQSTSFDILFLDINLPDGSGFDLLKEIPKRDFHVIFVTAYDQYALEAFKVSAADYLLKPISPSDLKKAVSNLQPISKEIQEEQKEIWASLEAKNFDDSQKIILRNADSLSIFVIKDIMYCEAQGSYTLFQMFDGSSVLASTHLKEYQKILAPYGFCRSHHSFLVNLEHIKTLDKSESTIVLSNDKSIPLSLRKRAELVNTLSKRFLGR